MMGGTWRLARSLGRLRTQLNDTYPGRSKIADGTIGDARHRARKSDHNPNPAGVVTAIDLTHSPAKGFDSYALAEHLRLNTDRRIKYVISARRWFSATTQPWVWRPYSGTPHTGHIHISAAASAALYDDNRDWNIAVGLKIDTSPDAQRDVLRRGSTGPDVELLQGLLGLTVDGVFGQLTETAVRSFQAASRVRVDGVVGARTWEHLCFLEEALE